MKIHLISYGNNGYINQKKVLEKTAISSLLFDTVTVYSPGDLDRTFLQQFHHLIFQHKGGGYWMWKPYLIKRFYDSIPSGDIVIYCDAGCLINGEGRKRFNEYMDIIVNSHFGSLAFELPHREIEYSKREVFDYFECSRDIIESNQLMATVILLRKTKHVSDLLMHWNMVLNNAPLLFTDVLDENTQYHEFIDHRHDQSIFSIIRKTYGSEIIADETYFSNFPEEGCLFPFWAARMRG